MMTLMSLAAWLDAQQMSRADFARLIGVTPGYITQLCNGKVYPRREIARRIKEATDGRVPPEMFFTKDGERVA